MEIYYDSSRHLVNTTDTDAEFSGEWIRVQLLMWCGLPVATKDKEIKLIAKGWDRTCRTHMGDRVTRHSVLDLLTFLFVVAYLPFAHNGTFHVSLCDADIAGPKHLQLLRSTLGNDWAFPVFSKVLFKSFFSFPLPAVIWDIPDEFRSLPKILP